MPLDEGPYRAKVCDGTAAGAASCGEREGSRAKYSDSYLTAKGAPRAREKRDDKDDRHVANLAIITERMGNNRQGV